MPLPLIPIILGVAAAGSALFGAKKAVDAHDDFQEAKNLREKADSIANRANDALERHRRATNTAIERYGKTKQESILLVDRFATSICRPDENGEGRVRIGRKFAILISKEEEISILKAVNAIDQNLSYADAEALVTSSALEIEAFSTIFKSATSGSLAGLAAGGASWLGVSTLGAASTGTAISGLSGAAATNATLAWLGGGSLASGGLGMAGGTAVLGGLVVAPVLLVGGMVLASKAEDERAEAEEHLIKTRTEADKIRVVCSKLKAIKVYTEECDFVLGELDKVFASYLDRLEAIAKRSPTLKELDQDERQLVYACYELKFKLLDFVKEGTMNEACDNVLPKKKRQAMKQLHQMKYAQLPDDFRTIKAIDNKSTKE